MFTDCKNNRFQNKLIKAERTYINIRPLPANYRSGRASEHALAVSLLVGALISAGKEPLTAVTHTVEPKP